MLKSAIIFILLSLCMWGTLSNAAVNDEVVSKENGTLIIVVKDSDTGKKIQDIVANQQETTVDTVAEPARIIEESSPANSDDPLEQISIVADFWKEIHSSIAKGVSALGDMKLQLLVLIIGLLVTYFVSWGVNIVFWKTLLNLTRRTKWKYDDVLCNNLKNPSLLFLCIVGVFLSFLPLFKTVGGDLMIVWSRGFGACIAISFVWGFLRLIDVLNMMLHDALHRGETHLDRLLEELLRRTFKVILVILAIFFIGQNILGLNLTSLLAGAGVVCLAVAFAAQESIANFFGSIVIIIDHSFKVGDWVTIGSVSGVVETMGLRSTRLRAPNGELYILPNKEVAASTIINNTDRPYTRYSFTIGLVYETSPEDLQKAREIIADICNNPAHFETEKYPAKIGFANFNAYSLDISVCVWFKTGSYWEAESWKNDMNMEIHRRFRENNLNMAFPTQTLYCRKEEI